MIQNFFCGIVYFHLTFSIFQNTTLPCSQHMPLPYSMVSLHMSITSITRLSPLKFILALQFFTAMELLLWNLSYLSPGELVPTVLVHTQIIVVLHLAAISFYMTISCIRNITSLWTDSMYYSSTLMFSITSGPFGLSVLYRTNTETGFQLILRVGSRCDTK